MGMPQHILDLERRREALLPRYDTRAPRYTSYPTAVQFTPQVDAESLSDWLAQLPVSQAISLYVHLPFCRQLCWYCGCNTRAVNGNGVVSSYIDVLEDELVLMEQFMAGRLPVGNLHLGGGTPNILEPEALDRLFRAMRFVFDFQSKIEIAAELDPATLTQEWVQAAVSHGLNRASLGIQTLAGHVQSAVNRPLSIEQVKSAMDWLRTAAVASINMDIMYGLPRQTSADVLSTLDQLLPLKPDRLALFGYAHMPRLKAHQRLIHDHDLPGSAQRLEQSELAAERLVEAGYQRIGLDHFARPADPLALAAVGGALKRNFQGYTSDNCASLLGIGASAISRLPQGYSQNETSELAWRKAVAAGILPVSRGLELTPEDRLRAAIIERLMCDQAVNLAHVARDHGCRYELTSAEKLALDQLRADGLVRFDGERLQITELGRPFMRSVALIFDQYADDETRYSRTV